MHNVHCQDKMIPVVFHYYATELVVYESSSLDIDRLWEVGTVPTPHCFTAA